MPTLKPGNEREPLRKVPVDYRPPDSVVHYVSDGENWQSVADKYGVDVKALIKANFGTLVPEEVNWYLNHYVCCDTPTPDGYNWRFSSTARKHTSKSPRAGIVYVPPRDVSFEEGDTIVVEIERLAFDGQRLSWLRGGRVVASWPAVSGKAGYQGKSHQRLKGQGPLPEGVWEVRQSEYQKMPDRGILDSLLAELGGTAWPGGTSSWGRHRIWLHPKPGTVTFGRGGFSIHGGDTPGSAGCIDLTTNMPYFAQRFLRHGKTLELTVKY
jgi:hypothetical protein